jgi:hypothetical protein
MQTEKLPLRLISRAAFALLLAIGLLSCSKESKLATHIPKDANAVLAFDVKSMGLKSLDFKEILTFDNLKKAFSSKSESDSAANSLKDSGIDFMNKAYFFAKAGTENKTYGVAVIALSDAAKFETFLKKMIGDVTITEEGDYKLASPDEKTMIGWSKSDVLVLYGSENPKETLLSLANLKKEESLASNSDSFKALEKESADIACWVSFEDFQKLIPAGVTPTTINLKETFLTATCNFENGQIVVDTKYTTNNETATKLNFIKANVSNDVSNALPGNSVIAMMGFAIDMEKTYNYLEQEKLLEVYGGMVTPLTGLTPKELFTMLSGDIAVTVNGMAMQDVQRMDMATGQIVTKQEPNPEYCVAIGITDKDKASQLLSHFAEGGMLTKNENFYSFQNKMFIVDKGTSLIITGTESIKQSMLDGKSEKLNGELSNLLSANASSMYVNFNNIPETFYNGDNASMKQSIQDTELEDITFTSSALSGNSTSGKLVVRFKEKGENSLITLGRVTKKFSEKMKTQAPVVATSVTPEEIEETEAVAN